MHSHTSPAWPVQATAAEQQKMGFRLEQGDDNAALWQCQPEEVTSFRLLATGWQLSSSSTSRLQNINGEAVETESTPAVKASPSHLMDHHMEISPPLAGLHIFCSYHLSNSQV